MKKKSKAATKKEEMKRLKEAAEKMREAMVSIRLRQGDVYLKRMLGYIRMFYADGWITDEELRTIAERIKSGHKVR
jgi:hypothetical protein